MGIKTGPVRGCIDYMPAQMEIRQRVTNIILQAYKNNGFMQIKTPILESLDLLCKGDTGDNSKLMFKTIKRGEKLDLTKKDLSENDLVEEGLRYDLTVPLVRFFSDNKDNLPIPFKSIQIDESFRAERPQRGRFRQFTQCDIDILGESTVLGEIEILTTVMQAYSSIGLKNLIVKINSRKILSALIEKCGFDIICEPEICIVIDKIDKIGIDGCRAELLSLELNAQSVDNLCNTLQSVRQGGIETLVKAGIAIDECTKINQLIDSVKQHIAKDYHIIFDIGIVRGQGYYTGTVYEVFLNEQDYKGAIGGGGRYDNMVEQIIGEKVPAIGFGIGLDVVLLAVSLQNITIQKENKKVALIYDKEHNVESIIKVKNELKKQYDITLVPQIKNFKELERKLKLNNYDGIIVLKAGTQVKWF